MARNFPGTGGNANQVNFGNPSSLDDIFDGGGTAVVMCRPESSGETGYADILSKITAAGGGFGWRIACYDESGTTMKIQIRYYFSSNLGHWDTTNRDVTENEWQTVGMNFDADSASNNPTLYIAGVKKTVGSGLTESTTPVGTRESDASQDLIAGEGFREFDGDIAYFAMWDVELSDDEHAALARGVSPLLIRRQNLKLFSILGHGANTTDPDLTGNQNNGSVTGTTVSENGPAQLLTSVKRASMPLLEVSAGGANTKRSFVPAVIG